MKQQNNPKEVLNELCRQQTFLQNHYNRFAGTSRGIPLRNTLLDILREEHSILGDLQNQLLERGLVEYDMATQEQIEQIKRNLKQRGIE